MTRGVLLLSSEQAGGTDEETLAGAISVLEADFTVEVVRTPDVTHLDRALDAAGERLLVVAGGDGSLHATVAALHRRGQLIAADLALLPLGTGNDFAHTVGLPLDATAAAAVIADSVRRPLDLFVDDSGDVVVNVVHAGVGAAAAERAARLKPVLGAAAYPLGALLAGITIDGWRVTVEVDGRVVHTDAPLLMVGICNGRTIGGGTPLCPPADPGDGLADVVVVTAVDAAARLSFGAALRAGEHVGRPDVVHVRGRSVAVRGEPIGYNADGEISEPVAARSFSVLPAAWTLRGPG